MLELNDLHKSYGTRKAIDGLSLSIRQGETLGLLGPNGAGKTTTVSILAGLLRPDRGELRWDGAQVEGHSEAFKRRIGYVPQDLALIEELDGRANLNLFGALYGLRGPALQQAVDEALDFVGLRDRAGDAVKHYSGGMKRRLNLVAALLHDPLILLLDEPTVGVDPQSRNAIFEGLETLKTRGKTLVYTTHYMEEAERLCDRIAIIDAGRILAEGTLAELLARLPAPNVLAVDLETDPGPGLPGRFATIPGVAHAGLDGQRLRLTLDDPALRTGPVLETLRQCGLSWSHLHTERASLESVFLNLTGRSLRDA
jgi:ABC-2 type transport system ATP-binding protein